VALKKNPKVDLKRKYRRYVETAMILALGILVVAFKFFPEFKKDVVKIDGPQELVTIEEVEATKQETAPPPPPKPPIPIEAPSDEEMEDIEISDTELDVDEEVAAPPPPPKVEEEEEAEPSFFLAVETMPAPIGGIGAIQKRIVYPEIAKRAGVQGRVFVKAFVDETGIVRKAVLIKGIGAGCDEEAIKAVKATKFTPGEQRGKPVRVQVSIPIVFRLQ